MPDPHRIKGELQALYSRPQFSSLFVHRNQFRKLTISPDTPESVATQAGNYLWKNNPLLDPVEILELRGPLELYRAHDGGSRLHSAGTLGRSWFERSVAETIWKGTAKYSGKDRFNWYMEFLRTANFVLPEWNSMLQIACMNVPAGASVVVARGRGSWKAMRTPVAANRPGGAGPIRTPDEVMKNAGMMPIPGVVQLFVPLWNDNWIQPVNYPSTTWPFIK